MHRCQQSVEHGEEIAGQWLDRLQNMDTLVFLGHGPHLATTRQVASMLHEWAKLPAPSDSISTFRHGPIEIVQRGVVLFHGTRPGVCLRAGVWHGNFAATLRGRRGGTRAEPQRNVAYAGA